jgi:transcriptional regulator with XRE-family HTH domain
MHIMMIGDKIKHMRKARGMTRKELGLCIGKDQSRVYRYEKGADIPLSVLEKIAATLDVPLKKMFE